MSIFQIWQAFFGVSIIATILMLDDILQAVHKDRTASRVALLAAHMIAEEVE